MNKDPKQPQAECVFVPATQDRHWLAIRDIRFHPANTEGYVATERVSDEAQLSYGERMRGCYWVLECDGEIVGFAGIVDEDIRVGVHPDFQHRGFGLTLLKEMAKIRSLADCKVRIRPENTASRALFEKMGFQNVGSIMLNGVELLDYTIDAGHGGN